MTSRPLIHDDGQRHVWRLGPYNGLKTSVDMWVALAKASRICVERESSIGGHRVTVTEPHKRPTHTRPGP